MENNSTASNKRHTTNNISYTAVVRVDADERTKEESVANGNGDAILLPRDHSEKTQLPEQGLWERLFSWRSIIIAILHASYLISIMTSIVMPMALVCMCGPIHFKGNETTDNLTLEIKGKGDTDNMTRFSTVSGQEEFFLQGNETFSKEKEYEFSWDSETRGLLLSAYLFTVFLSPHLSNFTRSYLGNKLTLTIFNMLLAFLSMLSPFAARTNVYFLLVVRILSGFLINICVPISADTLAWWLPAEEKLTGASIVVAGWMTGSTLTPVFAGHFCALPVDNGWPFMFYFAGIFITVWTIIWYFLSSRKPENHPFITEKEKAYIITHRVGMNQIGNKAGDKPPYRTILKSPAVLAFLVFNSCHFWAFVIIIMCLPAYLTSVLKFSLYDTGVIFAIMSGLRFPGMLFWTAIGNYLMSFKSMTTNKVRKITCTIAQALTGAFCLGVSFFDESNKWVATCLVILSVMASGFGASMSSVMPLDMAPRYSGFITGLAVSLAALFSLTSPLIVSTLTAKGYYEEWRIVWIFMAVVYVAAGAIFVVFGSASIQPWAVSFHTKDAFSKIVSDKRSTGDYTETYKPTSSLVMNKPLHNENENNAQGDQNISS